MNRPLQLLAALPLLTTLLSGCAAAERPAPVAAASVAAPAPAPLARSFYSKDAAGSLTEDDLQHVLESPVDLQFPARVGVVPLSQPFDAHSHASISTRSTASRDFAAALAENPNFIHVSDVSTELPNAGGIEGLRALAARYRMRYLILYSERFEDSTHVNGLGWFYPTILGMFVVPGVTVESRGLAQADLLDVRTGTVLFSVVEPMEVSSKELMVSAARAHHELQIKAAAAAAKKLAASVSGQTRQLLAYADARRPGAGGSQRALRILPAPVDPSGTPTATAQQVARP